MRIWQRIFLVTFTIVTTFLMFLGAYQVGQHFKLKMNMEKTELENIQSDIYSDFQYFIKDNENTYLWAGCADNRFLTCVEKLMERWKESSYAVKLWVNEEEYLSGAAEDEEYKSLLSSDKFSDGEYFVTESGPGKYIEVLCSKTVILDRDIRLVTAKDITMVCGDYHRQMKTIRLICVMMSLLAAVLLWIILYVQLYPVKRLREAVHLIAEGDYKKKLPDKGSTELVELSRDVNKMADKIEEKIDEMDEMLENRRIFIGDMAHEMKTPLTAILGFADILTIEHDLDDDKRREYSNYIFKEARRLKDISSKLMNLVQYEGKDIELNRMELGAVMEQIVEIEKDLYEDRNLRLEAELCYARIAGEADLLKSVFYNLLDNAAKASSEGGVVKLKMSVVQEMVEVVVQDFGIGMPKSEIDKITEPFYMVDKVRTRKAGGAGLGLALCKVILKLHGATLHIESRENEGSTFTVRIPLFQEQQVKKENETYEEAEDYV